MARLPRHPSYNFALILALCVGVGVAVLVLSQSHLRSAPQAAEIPLPSAHTGELPPLW
jgi:hypothetical protein